MSDSPAALKARAEAYWRSHAIALGMVGWCEQHGCKPDSFHHRAEEARREAVRAERRLRRLERRHPGSTVPTPA